MVTVHKRPRQQSARPNTISLLSMVMELPMRGRNSGTSYDTQKSPVPRIMPFNDPDMYVTPIRPKPWPTPRNKPMNGPTPQKQEDKPEKPTDRWDAVIEETEDGKERKRKERVKDSIRKWWRKTSGPGETSTVSPTDEDQKMGGVSHG